MDQQNRKLPVSSLMADNRPQEDEMARTAGVVLMIVGFALAYLLVRVIRKWFLRGRSPATDAGMANESRQVRRARERRERG
jgi:hypothetical protein